MGRATLVNGLVATAAGVVSNWLVKKSGGNYVSPFGASAVLLGLGWVVIRAWWAENYGAGGGGTASGGVVESDLFQVKRLGKAWNIVRQGKALISLNS